MSGLPQNLQGRIAFPLFHIIFHRLWIGVFYWLICLIFMCWVFALDLSQKAEKRCVLGFLNPYWNKETIFK